MATNAARNPALIALHDPNNSGLRPLGIQESTKLDSYARTNSAPEGDDRNGRSATDDLCDYVDDVAAGASRLMAIRLRGPGAPRCP
jgi:hypothetical protein